MPESPRLRVCYVVSHFYPHGSGAERQALAQGIELVKRGHDVQVVTRFYPHLERDSVYEGIRIHRWIDTSSRGPLFGLTFVASVVRALRRLRASIDVVHTHQALWESVAAGLARPFLKGVPTLIQPASSGYFGEAEELARTKGFPLLRRVSVRNTAFAAISRDIEGEWLDLGVPASRMIRLASGVDATHFRAGPSAIEASLPPRPRVVFTGRLHPQKNVDLLLDVWSEVARRTGAALVLVGDGVERERLSARATDAGIADRVVFVGAVDDPAEYLRAADAFVLPSVAEGMSNSLLEAMATALPCLASSIGGNTDLLGQDDAGMLVEPGDEAAWTEAICRVVSDAELAGRLGASARRRIEAEFALPVVVDRYVSLYRRLIAGEPASLLGS